PFEDGLCAALLDAADVAGVLVIDLLLHLAAGQHHLLGIDDDDVVAAVDMGRVSGLVLAAQAQRDDRSEPAANQALRADQDPLLVDFGRLGRIGLHEDLIRETWRRAKGGAPPAGLLACGGNWVNALRSSKS